LGLGFRFLLAPYRIRITNPKPWGVNQYLTLSTALESPGMVTLLDHLKVLSEMASKALNPKENP